MPTVSLCTCSILLLAAGPYGLLVHDMTERFLLHFFTQSAHTNTRGTFSTPESTLLDRDGCSARAGLQPHRLVCVREITRDHSPSKRAAARIPLIIVQMTMRLRLPGLPTCRCASSGCCASRSRRRARYGSPRPPLGIGSNQARRRCMRHASQRATDGSPSRFTCRPTRTVAPTSSTQM